MRVATDLVTAGADEEVQVSAGVGLKHVIGVEAGPAAGGPLALVRTGDWITLDVPSRALTLEVPDEELARRRAEWTAPPPAAARGWTRLYSDHVLQADTGADLDFLIGASGHEVPRDSH